jgi:flagellar biosynthesis/type III secretory pathway protein FliH
MTLALILGFSALTGCVVAFISKVEIHAQSKQAYEEGKADGFLEGVEKVKDMGYKVGRDKGYIEGLTKGRQEGHLAIRNEMTLVRRKRA